MDYEEDKKIENQVKEWQAKYETDLRERLLNFSVDVIRFLSSLPLKREYEVLRTQLLRSATSIGANYEEAQYSTYREFIARIRIVMREAAETKYWFRIIEKIQLGNKETRESLVQEIDQIVRIFGSILSKLDHKDSHS